VKSTFTFTQWRRLAAGGTKHSGKLSKNDKPQTNHNYLLIFFFCIWMDNFKLAESRNIYRYISNSYVIHTVQWFEIWNFFFKIYNVNVTARIGRITPPPKQTPLPGVPTKDIIYCAENGTESWRQHLTREYKDVSTRWL
jgi:hypothetical protein